MDGQSVGGRPAGATVFPGLAEVLEIEGVAACHSGEVLRVLAADCSDGPRTRLTRRCNHRRLCPAQRTQHTSCHVHAGTVPPRMCNVSQAVQLYECTDSFTSL